jgi:hypothetical protein
MLTSVLLIVGLVLVMVRWVPTHPDAEVVLTSDPA